MSFQVTFSQSSDPVMTRVGLSFLDGASFRAGCLPGDWSLRTHSGSFSIGSGSRNIHLPACVGPGVYLETEFYSQNRVSVEEVLRYLSGGGAVGPTLEDEFWSRVR